VINLMQGDCLERMKEIESGSVDMILADVPYGTTACKWDSIIPLEPMWYQLKRIIKPNGAIVMTASQPFTSVLVVSNIEMFRYSWVWEKEQGVNFLTAKKNPMKVHEDICVFYLDEAQVKGRSAKFLGLRSYFVGEKDKLSLKSKDIKKLLGNDMGGHYFTSGMQWTLPTKENYEKLSLSGGFKRLWVDLKREYDDIAKDCKIQYNPQMTKGVPYTSGLGNSGEVTGRVEKKQTKNKGHRYPRSVQKFNRETGLHPTQKPVALMEYLIKTYTNESEMVLDFTAGSFTTGVACVNLNRKFIGIEMDKNYFDIGVNRIKERIKCLDLKIEPTISMAG
jgi:DNA modification methylase